MRGKDRLIVLKEDVYALTPKAERELGGAGTSLSAPELEVLVLIDGKSTVAETAERARTMDAAAVLEVFRKLVEQELIAFAKEEISSLDFVDFFATKGPSKPSAAATANAKKASAETALLLQQQGYFVRIVRRPSSRRIPEQRQLSVIVIEDEPHLATMLKHVLEAEGFEVKTAKNREEIAAEFRQLKRVPDLVLLDVMLPDVDGFEVLLKIRQHPALKTTPVMMLTAKATRDAVLQGLAGGADGYITKPFEIEVLVKAINALLGLPEDAPPADTRPDPWG